MQRKRDSLVPVDEALADLPGPVKALIPSRPTQRDHKARHPCRAFAPSRKEGRMHRFATLLVAVLLPLSLLAQTEQKSRPQKLQAIFSNYELIHLDPKAIELQVKERGERLTLEVQGIRFVFEMKPRDLRSGRYLAEATGEDELRRYLPPPPVHTFKGVVVGQEHIQGRFTITEESFDGIIFNPTDWLYIEPLSNYLPDSESTETVIYKESDIRHVRGVSCGVSSLHHRLPKKAPRIENKAAVDTTTYYTAEVATEADYEYVQTIGSTQKANSRILSILNKIEGVYEDELRLRLEVVYQHAWTTSSEPYSGVDEGSDLLNKFREHWNDNFFHEDYDLAHLWTAKEELDIGGIAWTGETCRRNSNGYNYGVSTHGSNEASFRYAAHEIGHNFGAEHTDEESTPIESCEGTIMQSDWEPRPELTFCQFSRDEIRSHVSTFNSCLDEYTVENPFISHAPSDLTASTVNSTQIRLTWQNNSPSSVALNLQRKTSDGDWEFLAGLVGNRTTFLDADLTASTTYGYRVSAYSLLGEQWTAYSNTATATTKATTIDDDSVTPCVPDAGDDDSDSQYEVVSFSAKSLGYHQGFGYEYAFLLTLKNPTESNLAYELDILFRDSDGFVVKRVPLTGSCNSYDFDCIEERLPIPAGQTRTFEDTFYDYGEYDFSDVTIEPDITVAE